MFLVKHYRRYMAEILPIRLKTLCHQSINQSITDYAIQKLNIRLEYTFGFIMSLLKPL